MPCRLAIACTTPSSPETSSPGVLTASRGRNRFEVRFANRTGEPGGIASERAHAEDAAVRLMEILIDLEANRGTGRLWLP